METIIHIVAEVVLFIALYYFLSSRSGRAERRIINLEKRVAQLEALLTQSQPRKTIVIRTQKPKSPPLRPAPTIEEIEETGSETEMEEPIHNSPELHSPVLATETDPPLLEL